VPVFNLMEDAATAEISRSQIWQWIRSGKGVLDDGRKVTVELFQSLLAEEAAEGARCARRGRLGRRESTRRALGSSRTLITGDYVEFLTLPAYALID
jgi:malate synthase